jgi:hypothetical protein
MAAEHQAKAIGGGGGAIPTHEGGASKNTGDETRQKTTI